MIRKITIKSFMGLEDYVLEPGPGGALLSGHNGSGKTSAIKALITALGGGAEGRLIMNGSEAGEVGVVIDQPPLRIERKITRAKRQPPVKVFHADEGKKEPPQEYLDKLIDALTLNPVDFAEADKPEDRMKWLLSAITLAVAPEQIEACGVKITDDIRKALESGDAISVIDKLAKKIEEERRDIGKEARENQAAAEKLTKTLRPDDGKDWAEEERAIAAKLDSISQRPGAGESARILADEQREAGVEYEREKARIEQERDKTVRDCQEEIRELQRLIATFEQQIETAQTNAELELKAQASARDNRIKAAGEKSEQSEAAFQASIAAEKQQLTKELEHAREIRATLARDERTRKDIEEYAKIASEKDQAWKDKDAILKELKKLKVNLLSSLPIDNLDIQDGDISINGVPFDLVNTAERIIAGAEVGYLRAKELGIMCIDGAERLDSKHRTKLMEWAKNRDIQLIMTRVNEEEFNVSTW